MKNKLPTILSTRLLDQSLLDEARASGVVLETMSFIETVPRIDEKTREQILMLCRQKTTVVFTSARAVEAVAACIAQARPSWKIACIGRGTREKVAGAFGAESIFATADSARTLAETIIQSGNVASVTFFCGDRRRDELPDALAKARITVQELQVYVTQATPQQVAGQYDGIVFFSPSAVDSFFSVNHAGDHPVLFALGATTAAAIKKQSGNTLIQSASPVKQALIRLAVAYFKENQAPSQS